MMVGTPKNQAVPSAIEMEACTLGSMVLSQDCIPDVEAQLDAGDFFRPAHHVIFRSLCEMWHKQIPIDLVAVSHWLADKKQLEGIGGVEYLVALTEGVPDAANVLYYAKIVKEKSLRRRLIIFGKRIANEAYDAGVDVAEIIELAEGELIGLDTRGDGEATVDLADISQVVMNRAEQIQQEKAPPGLPTGFDRIDEPIGGMKPGHLVTLAGGTSVGKSALAVCIARNVAEAGGSVLFVSAEMSADEVAQRFLQVEGQVAGGRIDSGHLDEGHWQQLSEAQGQFTGWNVRIHGKAATVSEIGAMARKAALQWRKPLSLIVADYVQLLLPPSDIPARNREMQVNAIARGLKQLAGTLGTPVLMLAQLNRDYSREKRRPELHDLRESGALEQHSNSVILMCYPPEDELNITPITGEHTVWLRIAKARSGRCTRWPDTKDQNSISLRFVPPLTKFRQ